MPCTAWQQSLVEYETNLATGVQLLPFDQNIFTSNVKNSFFTSWHNRRAIIEPTLEGYKEYYR